MHPVTKPFSKLRHRNWAIRFLAAAGLATGILGGGDVRATDHVSVGIVAGCGDGVIEIGEGCDDGNTMPGDGCNADCLIELLRPCTNSDECASGLCDPSVNQCTCNDDEDCGAGQGCNLGLSPNQCVPIGCGNNMPNPGEGCDDGNLNNGDGCSVQCLIELTFPCTVSTSCASGFCDNMVCACDAHVDCPGFQLCNIQATPNVCVDPGCGNFVIEMGEGCDDGNTMSGDGCTAMCLLELGESCTTSTACASGTCDPIDTTCVCDENADCPSMSVCKFSTDPNTCVPAGCGNGVLEMGEACDDDNTMNGDGCNSTCFLENGQQCPGGATTCASGFCDPVDSVCTCDEDKDCSGMQLCNIVASPNQCVDPGCGNSVLEMGEGCDDGNTSSDDGCNNACLLEIGQACIAGDSCASGFCDPTDNTCACDDNADCSGGQVCNLSASPHVCVDPGCGNSVVDSGEGCDDGNMMPDDGCGATCLLELGQTCNATSGSCESGFCDSTNDVCACDQDSDCPTGNVCDTIANPNLCVVAGCGNSVLEPNEGCDDGNTSPGDGCAANCTKEIGETCTDGMECGSGNCDGTVNKCVCDKDTDCPMSEVCDTNANPHACIVPPPTGCTANTDCMEGLVCDQSSGKCVECINDSDCAEGATCTAETYTCKSGGIVIEGGGILCAASSTSTSGDNLPFGLLGLLGLGALRRRRR